MAKIKYEYTITTHGEGVANVNLEEKDAFSAMKDLEKEIADSNRVPQHTVKVTNTQIDYTPQEQARLDSKEAEYQEACKIKDRVQQGLGITKCIWSAGHEKELERDEVAIQGWVMFLHSDHWGAHPVESEEMENPTYQDIFRTAEKLIIQSGDSHHVFLEAWHYDAGNSTDDLQVYRLSYGS